MGRCENSKEIEGQVNYRRKNCIKRDREHKIAGMVMWKSEFTKYRKGIWWSGLWEQQWGEETEFQVLLYFMN